MKATLSLKRFLLIEQCPEAWQSLDLYLFRDDAVTFYVGQSHRAFARVWQHLLDGFKGRSLVGRFVWSNWPTSMKLGFFAFPPPKRNLGVDTLILSEKIALPS